MHHHQCARAALAGLLLLVGCESSPPGGMGPNGGVQNGVGAAASGGTPANAGSTGGAGSSSAAGHAAGGSNGVSAGTGVPGAASGAGGTNGGAGSGGTMSSGPSNPLDVGKYFQSGAWMGYVWTAANGAGSTISPMDFAGQTTGMPRCVKGSVAATADYSGTAILGLNLSEGTGVTSMTVTPTKAGVLVDVTNKAGSPLRFQIKSAINGGTEWCTALTGSGGFIPWTSLRTKCWDSTGVAYNREPIAAAMVLVPGTNSTPVAFDFCLNSLVEADAPAGGSAGAGASGNGGTAGTGTAGNGGAGSGGTTAPPLQGNCSGYATRYWDCCKPHCGWSANAPSGPLAACDASDNGLGGNFDAANSCTGGPAFMCHSNVPWAVSDRLAYGFAAVAARSGSDICGKCYQLEFTGSSHNGSDPGSAALAGKTMIVQAVNIGGDVGHGQFDIAVPGGGVGAFNACSTQWSALPSQLGATYGGFLASCKQQANSSDLQALKSCVMQKCTSIFEQKGFTELAAGCRWFVEWFQAADNPNLKYGEVACPNELMNRGMRRGGGGGGACLP